MTIFLLFNLAPPPECIIKLYCKNYFEGIQNFHSTYNDIILKLTFCWFGLVDIFYNMFSGARWHHLQSYTTKIIAYLKEISHQPILYSHCLFQSCSKMYLLYTHLYVALYTDKVLICARDSFTGWQYIISCSTFWWFFSYPVKSHFSKWHQ